MNMTHTAKATIQADVDTIWEAITETDFVKDFLPEVRKNLQAMGEYAQATHRNAQQVLPAYAVPGQAIGWNAVTGTTIALPRKDTPANIEAIDIQLEKNARGTKVTIEVQYNPKLGENLFETRRCLKGLFGIKLNVLKQDLEADQAPAHWMPAFA